MIAIPPGWKVIPEVGMVELAHPELGSVRYRERVRPLKKLGVLVREYLASIPSFVLAAPITTERLVTLEGEHAALVTLRGASSQHDLGFVFGDDFYAQVWSECGIDARRSELTALVRHLVTTDSHGLGVRRRRFEYAPPADWEPISDGFVTDWYPPEFPNDSIILTMRPASPRTLEAIEIVASMVQELGTSYRVEVPTPPAPIVNASGLQGIVVTLHVWRDTDVIKQVAVVQDKTYTYSVEITASSQLQLSAHPRLVERIVDSIKPVPQQTPSSEARFLAHWAE